MLKFQMFEARASNLRPWRVATCKRNVQVQSSSVRARFQICMLKFRRLSESDARPPYLAGFLRAPRHGPRLPRLRGDACGELHARNLCAGASSDLSLSASSVVRSKDDGPACTDTTDRHVCEDVERNREQDKQTADPVLHPVTHRWSLLEGVVCGCLFCVGCLLDHQKEKHAETFMLHYADAEPIQAATLGGGRPTAVGVPVSPAGEVDPRLWGSRALEGDAEVETSRCSGM
jgi:hypothetical protein